MQEFRNKAEESLAGAEAEPAAQRYGNCANRADYACFQAAVSALWSAGIRPPGGIRWSHSFVQSEFAGQLVNRRKLCQPELRDTLDRAYDLRQRADYGLAQVPATEATRAVHRARALVAAVRRRTVVEQ